MFQYNGDFIRRSKPFGGCVEGDGPTVGGEELKCGINKIPLRIPERRVSNGNGKLDLPRPAVRRSVSMDKLIGRVDR